MPEPLARDEDRAADVEAEGVVLERRPVPVAHQEPDQPRVRVVHFLAPAGEADARGVHDREVVGHRRVETDEAVVEDGDRAVGYHFSGDCHGFSRVLRSPDGNGVSALIGTSGWSYPSWRPDFYPAGLAERGIPRLLLAAVPVRRAQLDRLPPSVRRAVRALGGRHPGRVPLRGEGLTAGAPVVRHVRGARPDARRQARPGPRRRREPAGRRPARPPARLDRPSAGARPEGRELGRCGRRTGRPGQRRRTPTAPFRYLRFREPPYSEEQLVELAATVEPLLAAGLEVFAYFQHEDAPTATAYAARLLELVQPHDR